MCINYIVNIFILIILFIYWLLVFVILINLKLLFVYDFKM